MNKILISTLAASIVTLSSTIAIADPRAINFEIQCPNAQNHSNVLSNYGDFIAGYGLEKIQGQEDSSIYFKSTSSVKGVPAELDRYSNGGAAYNSTNGNVSCVYYSALGAPSFEVSYTITNGKGGKVVSFTNDKINILIPLGLKA